MNERDTDFSQFEDTVQANRRTHDAHPMHVENCAKDDCPAIYILERRVDRHRHEIDELKTIMKDNGAAISEVLEIVSMAKSFFKAVGWLADKAKAIIAVGGLLAAAMLWFREGWHK